MILDFDFVQEEGNTNHLHVGPNYFFYIQVLKLKKTNGSKYADKLCLLHPEHIVNQLIICFTTLKV